MDSSKLTMENIRIVDPCCICYAIITTRKNLDCEHYVCVHCYDKIIINNTLATKYNIICPLCRHITRDYQNECRDLKIINEEYHKEIDDLINGRAAVIRQMSRIQDNATNLRTQNDELKNLSKSKDKLIQSYSKIIKTLESSSLTEKYY